MTSYTLGQAAKATGKNKATIAHAIKKGRLSATKNDLGEYQIDPVELSRVYPIEPCTLDPKSDDVKPPLDPALLLKLARLEWELETASKERDRLREEMADVKHDRDEWRMQAKMYLPAPRPDATKEFQSTIIQTSLPEDIPTMKAETKTTAPKPQGGFWARLFRKE